MRILVLNGANLNLLGNREPNRYGTEKWEDIQKRLEEFAGNNDVELTCYQSNHEGDLIEMLHKSIDTIDLIILNPGGFTHYSVSLRDAVLAVQKPVIEVHLSNIFAREDFRRQSLFSDISQGVISGFHGESYDLALQAGVHLVKKGNMI
ncbi:MAG: type II 3-dehydroquinate dehydratase [Candidatus Schekmanbacteria bacterium RBG_13_48_7]|uniref:3-dehydroquinate dehydratase n=1 Tax=Candidatus Schekmanbacteria bacterium RBG_13_48_7 TaxID=1817878 RepID=A0A1F7RM27_9BACT|nr:MAG: type II 3-dehydroquinate dehydratase [Candidatus Schekmanbacteria bacterium RBG_13_48_7]